MEGNSSDFPNRTKDLWFEPAQSDKELNNLLVSLDSDGEEELNFENTELKAQVDSMLEDFKTCQTTEEYLDSFEQTVRHDVLLIGSLSAEQVELHEKALKENRIKQQQLEMLSKQKREQVLALLVDSAKKRLTEQLKERNKSILNKEYMLKQQEKILQSDLQKAFNQAESELFRFLEQRKAEIQAFYGILDSADSQYGGSKGRRWRVEWTKTPQPIQININCIRGVKDKLPSGRYSVMVSLYDQLGGHPLKWSKLRGQQWSGSTLPVFHNGQFNCQEMTVDQNLFTVLPSQWYINPGMVLVFEIFLLRGEKSPLDRVVAWGCFPVCNKNFEIIRGKFKLPLLRGFIDDRITKHSTIERIISSDVDHWLANLYIDITRLPRYLSGQKEHEVELQFSSAMISFPDRLKDDQVAADGEKLPEYHSETGSQITPSSRESKDTDSLSLQSHRSFHVKTSEKNADYEEYTKKKDLFDVDEKNKMNLKYKSLSEQYASVKQISKVPKKNVLPVRLTHAEQLNLHTASVRPKNSLSKLKRSSNQNAEFLGRMLVADAGFSQWKKPVFWIGVFIMSVLWFLRLYIHYCGQWLLLQAIGIPVSSFNFQPYTVDLNYQADLLSTAEEIAVIVMGPFSNILFQMFFVLIFWMCHVIFGELPLIVSKTILLFCIWTIVDPIMILIVDSCLQRYLDEPTQPIGDAFKLYWHFYRIEGSGVVGIPLTIFLYAVIVFTSLVFTYIYFLKLHNNGRIQDVYHRLHAPEEELFTPHDMELSNEQLSFIINKCEMWRGNEGERRKTCVYDYIWDEQSEGNEINREVTRHITIHTLHLDGMRQLYRHFLVLPDGAIVEVFDEMKLPSNSSPDIETELVKKGGKIMFDN